MKVQDVMTKAVGTCAPNEGANVAAGIMREFDCGIVPVVEEHRVVGVVTDRDLCLAALEQGKALHEIEVRSAMSGDVLTCAPTDTIERAEETLRAGKVRRLPVVADGALVGMISLDDIALAVVRAEGEQLLAGTPGETHLAHTLAAIYRRRIIVQG